MNPVEELMHYKEQYPYRLVVPKYKAINRTKTIFTGDFHVISFPNEQVIMFTDLLDMHSFIDVEYL